MQVPHKPSRGKPAAPTAGGRPNTIGLGQRELGELLDRLEHPDAGPKNPKRDFVRWPFRETSVRVQILHSGGTAAGITVACRNISRAGMAILHSAFAHTGTKCRVYLPHPTKGEVPVSGVITRCSHRSGVVHEIGIRFERHLNVQEFLPPDLFADRFSLERVRPDQLSGTVVYVEDSDIDRKIIKHFLRETRIRLNLVASGAEALKCIDESVDVALVDFHLGDMTGAELATKLREHGLKVPTILLTCDRQAATPEALKDIRAFLAKPVSQDLLMRALAEFLIVQRSAPSDAPRAVIDNTNPALTEGLLQALGQYARKLEDFVQKGNAESARTVCLQIAGTAGTVGFSDVNQMAIKAADALSRSMSIAESLSQVRALITVCRRCAERGGDAARTAA